MELEHIGSCERKHLFHFLLLLGINEVHMQGVIESLMHCHTSHRVEVLHLQWLE